ncbi:hypothetical protein [Terasakiella pusilla]|uniref:hypothetical protein n=1 Tax=Terasakiella pusilla TaxID=64973 RepID=UPI003AA7F11D
MVTINKTFISDLRRLQGKPVEYFDTAETGFGIRIGKKGQVKFLIDYTLLQYDPEKGIAKEKRFRKVFGSWHRDKTNAQINIFTADDARKHVRKMLELAAEDKDPFSKSTAIRLRTH